MPYKSREDQRAYVRMHYIINKNAYITKASFSNKKTRNRNRQFLNDYLSTHPCVDCGESDPVVLEFDHVRGYKKANLSDMAHKSLSLQSLKMEITKCEVRCANCHRRVTHERRILRGGVTVAQGAHNSKVQSDSGDRNQQLSLFYA